MLAGIAGAFAQKADAAIRKGNELYKQKNYEGSLQEYDKALGENPKNNIAHYNMGNAQFKNDKLDEAIQSYNNAADNSDKTVKEKAFYNKGVALSKQKKLQESIDAWKDALKLDPNDNETRENLQKALIELKKQQQQNDQNKEKKDKKQPKPQDQKQPPPSKLNKQQIDQLLKALAQKEKEVQQKLQKGSPSVTKPEKDW